jgi:LacI family transcriptional regulator
MGELAARFPLVVLGASTDYLRDAIPIPCVDSTNWQASYDVVKDLIELGHRRIAIVSLNSEHCNYQDRLSGYLSAHADAGLAVDPRDLVLFPAGFDGNCERIVEQWVERGLRQQSLPTAAFTCDLGTTLLVLKTLRESRISVPDDMSIVCFDDSPLFDHTTPLVTAVRQPLLEMGRRATERLLGRFGRGGVAPDHDGTELLPTRLISRASVAAPPTSRR